MKMLMVTAALLLASCAPLETLLAPPEGGGDSRVVEATRPFVDTGLWGEAALATAMAAQNAWLFARRKKKP